MKKAEIAIALMPVSENQIRIVIKPTGTYETFVWIESDDNIHDEEAFKNIESRAKELANLYEIPYEGIWEYNPFTRMSQCYFCGRTRPDVGNTHMLTYNLEIICDGCIQQAIESWKKGVIYDSSRKKSTNRKKCKS